MMGEYTGDLYKHKPDDEKPLLLTGSDIVLDEENLQHLLKPLGDWKLFSPSHTVWNDRKCQAEVSNPSLKQGKGACGYRYRAVWKYVVVPEGEILVGTLPDGAMNPIFTAEEDGRRTAMTDCELGVPQMTSLMS